MIIEIRKAGFVNKGAELMLYAILHRMREVYPSANFAMVPPINCANAPYLKRAELKFLQKASLWYHRFQLGSLAALAPRRIREMYGVVLDKEINLVLDAAGFAYSDQWKLSNSLELANSCKRWKKNGTKVILLPQAFGPFTSRKIQDCMKIVADCADLIFARERISYEHLVNIVGERPNIKLAPDFTNLVEGILPDDFDIGRNRFSIVPNYRMIDKTHPMESEAYLPFLIKCAQYLCDRGAKPFILVHEGAADLLLAEKICEGVSDIIPIVRENNPIRIKGILGACDGTIGSRFHGLVSALSQGVPSLATGWSHKYQMLFQDYGFAEGLIDVMGPEEEIYRKIDLVLDSDSRQRVIKTLQVKSNQLKQLSEHMWLDVFEVINRV